MSRLPLMTPGETAMRLRAVQDRDVSRYWLMRLHRTGAAVPRIDATWQDVEEWVSRCLLARDVYGVFSHLGAHHLEFRTLPDGGALFVAQIPIVGGWKTRLEVESDPTKVHLWKAACAARTQPLPAAQLCLF